MNIDPWYRESAEFLCYECPSILFISRDLTDVDNPFAFWQKCLRNVCKFLISSLSFCMPTLFKLNTSLCFRSYLSNFFCFCFGFAWKFIIYLPWLWPHCLYHFITSNFADLFNLFCFYIKIGSCWIWQVKKSYHPWCCRRREWQCGLCDWPGKNYLQNQWTSSSSKIWPRMGGIHRCDTQWNNSRQGQTCVVVKRYLDFALLFL